MSNASITVVNVYQHPGQEPRLGDGRFGTRERADQVAKKFCRRYGCELVYRIIVRKK